MKLDKEIKNPKAYKIKNKDVYNLTITDIDEAQGIIMCYIWEYNEEHDGKIILAHNRYFHYTDGAKLKNLPIDDLTEDDKEKLKLKL